MDFLMALMVTHDLSELSSYKTGIIPDCQYPGGGNKSLSSGKTSGQSGLGSVL